MEFSKNNNIIEIFEKLDNQYQNDSSKNQFQKNAIKKSIKLIKEYQDFHNKEIESKEEALKIKGIGKSIGDKIDEIIKTGTLSILKKKDDIIENELIKISGLGDSRIKKLNDLNIYTIKSLKENLEKNEVKKLMTEHIEIGIKYYEDFNERIPRKEIVKYKKYFDKLFKNLDLIYEICGSFRRLKEDCGDIDILVTHKSFKTKDLIIEMNVMSKIIDLLIKSKILLEDGIITPNANIKFMGTTKLLLKNSKARRLDIRIIEYTSFPTAIMYFTGSAEFNVRMRNKAIDMNMKLNEYGLFNKNEKIKLSSEKDIFDILEEPFLEPHKRI